MAPPLSTDRREDLEAQDAEAFLEDELNDVSGAQGSAAPVYAPFSSLSPAQLMSMRFLTDSRCCFVGLPDLYTPCRGTR